MTDRRAAASTAVKGAVSRSDRARLLRSWTEKWPGHPDAAESKHRFPYRWVRFDSLPESKRYPETDAEYEVLLSRHHAVLRELAGQRDAADEALIVSMSASSSPRPTRRGSAVASAAPHAKHWSSFAVDESGPETYWQHAYLSRLPLDPHRLDPLLRAVADGVAWGIIIAPDDLDWLYHPYDGGADVFPSTTRQQDELAAAHRNWLSSHPQGL